jgi:hypothetical protein
MVMIEQVSRDDYDIRGFNKGSRIELEWYATKDNKVVGVVLVDTDEKFNWMVFTENDSGPGFTGVDLGVGVEIENEAITQLHRAMLDERRIQELKR